MSFVERYIILCPISEGPLSEFPLYLNSAELMNASRYTLDICIFMVSAISV